MMTEMDDVMVLESLLPYPKDLDKSVLAARAREMQEAVSENGVIENSVDSPASGAKEVTEQVVGMETSPPALTHSPGGDDMSKHGDGARTESAQGEDVALPIKPSEGGRVIEQPFESSTFSSLNSGNSTDIPGEGTGMAQKKCRNRGKNWAKLETDDLSRAVLNTKKVGTRVEQGAAPDSYWDTIAKAVPGRTGDECRGRMDTLKRSFRAMKEYCDGHRKEFKDLDEKDFLQMKVSPRLTKDWYNQIRDNCKKSKTNGAGSSSKSTGFGPDTLALDLQPPVVLDGIDQGEPAMVWRLEYGVGIQQKEFVTTRCQAREGATTATVMEIMPSSEIDLIRQGVYWNQKRLRAPLLQAHIQGEPPVCSLLAGGVGKKTSEEIYKNF